MPNYELGNAGFDRNDFITVFAISEFDLMMGNREFVCLGILGVFFRCIVRAVEIDFVAIRRLHF
ncbi:MAG: hypothetical protein M0Q21_08055 [Ignavibacteriaceae bacterium]|nr:hypothetical protein [Ignavibacteriaceae bacterium]